MAGGVRDAAYLVDQVSNSLGLCRREPMDAFEVARVLEWKAKTRASWQACADFCGRPVADVRRACEAVLRPFSGVTVKPAKPTREAKILAAVADHPQTQTQLQVAVGCKGPELRPILERMIAAGQLESRPGRGGGVLLARPGGFPARRPEPVKRRGKRKPVREPVLAALAAGHALTSDIARAVGLTKPTVGVCLSKLVAEGLVEHRRIKGSRAFHHTLVETPE